MEPWICKIGLINLDHGHSEPPESPGNALGILSRWLDPDVEVFGITRLRVENHGVATNDEEFNLFVGEDVQQIFEVGVH